MNTGVTDGAENGRLTDTDIQADRVKALGDTDAESIE